MNWLLSAIFLADSTYRLFTAESKSRYFFRQFGTISTVGSGTSFPSPTTVA
jgi:hypothetical protein